MKKIALDYKTLLASEKRRGRNLQRKEDVRKGRGEERHWLGSERAPNSQNSAHTYAMQELTPSGWRVEEEEENVRKTIVT